MITLPKLPGNKILSHKTVLYQDATSSHYDFTSATPTQDFVLLGIPANHIVLGIKINLLIEFVNTVSLTPANTLLYVGIPTALNVSPGTVSGDTFTPTSQPLDTMLANMILSPTVQYGSTPPNTSYWFTVAAPGSFSGSGGICKPQSFLAHDIVARFLCLSSTDTLYNVNGLLEGMVEITVQYCAI